MYDPDREYSDDEEPEMLNPTYIAGYNSGKAAPYYKEKWWGYELTYINEQEAYCSKVLFIKDGGHTSMHFHVNKHETLLVVDGTLTLEYIVDKEKHVTTLEKGEAWIVSPGFIHKLIANDGDVTIVESSTFDSSDDSVRVHA